MADTFLNAQELSALEQALKDATSEEASRDINIDWSKLHAAAITFLTNYENLRRAQNHAQLKNIQTLINSPETTNYVAMRRQSQDAYYTKAKYLLAFEFDRVLNVFLGGLPKEAVYVFEDKKTGNISTYKMSMTELAKHANASGRLFIGINKLKRATSKKSSLQREERQSVEMGDGLNTEHVLKAQAAYKGVTARLNRYFEKKRESLSGDAASKMQRQSGILMWKLSKDWTLARVLNQGDLKEAYAAALLAKHATQEDKIQRSPVGKPDYYSHELISTFYNSYVTGVTNQAAITGEDIIGDTNQYGVKSIGANLPGLNQYLDTANWIKSQNSITTPTELRSWLDENFQEGAVRNQIIPMAEYVAEQSASDLISDMERQVISTMMHL